MGKISGGSVKGWWYNPRTGSTTEIEAAPNQGTREFTCPSEGFGSEWVLVLDDSSKSFGAPGRKR